ncbi:amidohydrolase family protein, partial [bacterium]|nr:amidohydrolase family protein [bacterium]
MKKIAIHDATIITMDEKRSVRRADILIEGSIISKIGNLKPGDYKNATRIRADGLTATPGLIQTHVHLCQTLFRNLADDLELLDWLKLKIWPFEAAHTPASIRSSARLALAELIRGGTTTILDMGTVHHHDYIFEQIEASGIRAFSGKAMMDECPGGPKGLEESRAWSIGESLRLKRDWHNRADGRIQFAFAPRFVLSCSESLLCDVRDLSRDENLL